MQFKVRNHPVGKEQLLPFQSLFGRSLIGLGRSDRGDRLLQSGFIGHLVDDKEHLALAHMGTLLDQHPGDGTRHLRAHLHILFSFYHSRVFHRELPVFRLHRQERISIAATLHAGLLLTSRQHAGTAQTPY